MSVSYDINKNMSPKDIVDEIFSIISKIKKKETITISDIRTYLYDTKYHNFAEWIINKRDMIFNKDDINNYIIEYISMIQDGKRIIDKNNLLKTNNRKKSVIINT